MELARQFVGETSWPVTFDAEAAELRFRTLIASPYADVIVIRGDGIVGVAIVAMDRDFTAEWWGYLVKLYIMPEARRAEVAVPLIRFCVRWFHDRRCRLAFATATAGLAGHGFEVLMRRAGFAICGPTYVREFPAKEGK